MKLEAAFNKQVFTYLRNPLILFSTLLTLIDLQLLTHPPNKFCNFSSGYVITIKSNSEEALIFIDPDKSSYTILNLKCGNKYSLLIQAINSIGRSNGSNMIHIKTQGDGNILTFT